MSKDHSLFIDGSIPPDLVSTQIAKQQTDLRAGAHSIFLGQVRNDPIDEKRVHAIEYTAYEEMVLKEYESIKEELFDTYPLRTIEVFHSLGTVPAGEVSLFVIVTAEHRKEAINACRDAVNFIKKQFPIWGRELLGDEGYQWKENNFDE
ncbi:molybdenum cofactor biosynthesis protein MoaE [Aliifodinibius sp. S!AR15-10]|uniref:molybdenum cofactor biosynthesis protein MoaE n=1 Tax=Aliifodinibius sp. S!AR15-10 TaxID=2950437 RepID=UPI00285863B4|nr:molybdenum cofactor biosynthesis protein MoaE [Aliifodinibius sp. S!AR15-10]MDR8390737.1 molybdenum cofactor biosynthesis protein MoaE [Aliifodinibius sp. S!AR15-10]